MCILFISHGQVETTGYHLVVVANRDELLERPSRPAHFWPSHAHVLAGVDERADRPAMGTWLGVSKRGRVAGITNFHTPASRAPVHVGSRGRGTLVGDFLRQDAGSTAEEIDAYTAAIQAERAEYGAFTVLLWQLHPGRAPECRAITNVEDTMPPFDNGAARVPPGVHVLTNGPLNIDWFKASHGRQQFEQVLAQKDASREDKIQGFLRLLKDQTLPPEGSRGPPMKELSSINVYHPNIANMGPYGTRAHTIILVDKNFHTYFEEHQRMPDGSWHVVRQEFDMEFH